MSERQRILIVITLLFGLVLASAVLLIYSKHESRKLFVEVQQNRVPGRDMVASNGSQENSCR